MAISERCDRRDFGNEPVDLLLSTLDVEDLLGVGIKSRKRTQGCFKHSHWVRVVVEAVDHLQNVFVDERVKGDLLRPLFELRLCGKFTVEQQVCDFEISALLCELIDGITAVLEDSFVAV